MEATGVRPLGRVHEYHPAMVRSTVNPTVLALPCSYLKVGHSTACFLNVTYPCGLLLAWSSVPSSPEEAGVIFRDSRMEGKKAIDVDGEFLYGTDMTLRAHFSDYDEESERLVWLRRGSPDAVRFFHDDIDNRLGPDVAIVTVPSHSPSRGQNVGIGSLAEALAKGRRVNLGVHLRRHKKVPSLTEQPIREIELHLENITAAPRVFAGREILLLDDLAFTGNSMKACGELLMRAGASRVGF